MNEIIWFNWPRQTGKTTKLIEISSETGMTIVTNNYSQRNFIMEQAIRMGKQIPKPITYSELLSESYFPRKKITGRDILLDDFECHIEDIIKCAFPNNNVKYMTSSIGSNYDMTTLELFHPNNMEWARKMYGKKEGE